MTILITGASGFIGTNLVPYLKRYLPDVAIRTLGRSGTDIIWDKLSVSDIEGIDAVIHLAGKAHDTKNTSTATEYFDVNYELTRKLFDMFAKNGKGKFIYVSSVKAAADTVEGILTETDSPNPKTPYGQSKLKAENYILNYNKPSQLDCYILRPCMVHGPGNKGNLNLLYRFLKKGIPYPLSAFDNQRSFLTVENFCFVVKELLTRKINPGVYNVADDEALSTTELMHVMATAEGKNAKLWSIPKAAILNLAKLGDMLKLPLNSERLKKLTESYVVSNAKIKSALGIQQMPVSVRDGLTQTIKTFK